MVERELTEKTLMNLGLNQNEVMIYLDLLPLGTATASILGRRVGILRNTAQYTCQQLVKKGLIRLKKEGNTYLYSPESPKKIFYLLEKENSRLEKKKEGVNRIISQLIALTDPGAVLPKVRFYEGISGIKQVYEDTLKESSTIYAFQNANVMAADLRSFLLNYVLERKLKNIFAYVITPDDDFHREVVKIDSERHRETKFFPQKIIPLEVEINIYGNKVAFFSYKEEELFGVILESPAISRSMKAIFDTCWNQAF